MFELYCLTHNHTKGSDSYLFFWDNTDKINSFNNPYIIYKEKEKIAKYLGINLDLVPQKGYWTKIFWQNKKKNIPEKEEKVVEEYESLV